MHSHNLARHYTAKLVEASARFECASMYVDVVEQTLRFANHEWQWAMIV
jgi:hypothetical protein